MQATSARASGPPGISMKDSTLVIGVPVRLLAATLEQFRRNRRSGSGYGHCRMAPVPDEQHHEAEPQNGGHDRYCPSQAIETVRRWLGEYRLAVLLHKGLQN